MTKSLLSPLAVALCAVAFLSTPAAAQVPQLLNYQGRVAVGTPNPVNFDGSGSFKFALVNAAGTTTYWSNDGTSIAGAQPTATVALTVTKGLYSVLLGDTTVPGITSAIPASVWTNADVRLRVWFNDGTSGSQLLTPDQRLAPIAYLSDGAVSSSALAANAVTSAKIASAAVGSTQLATNAVTAANIAAGAVGSTQLAAGAVGSAQLASSVATGLWTASGSAVYRSAGNVGIGTMSPAFRLTLTGVDVGGGQSDLMGLQDAAGTTKWHLSLRNGALNFVETGIASGRLYLAPGGNVGVGTLNPAFRLTLRGVDAGGGESELMGLQDAGGTNKWHLSLLNGALSFTETGIAGGRLFLAAGGKVGIGTTSPAFRLTVTGVDVGGGQSDLMGLQDAAGTNKWHVSLLNGSLNFTETGIASGRLFLAAGGSVGIGTTTPKQKLDVIGNGVFRGGPAGGADPGDGAGPATRIGYDAIYDYGFITANETGVFPKNLILQKDGSNVGIGTTTVGSKLTVNGVIESRTGGVKFPDGSVQTKAAPGYTNSQFLSLSNGSFLPYNQVDWYFQPNIPNGSPSDTLWVHPTKGTWNTRGNLVAPVNLPHGAQVLSITAHVYDSQSSIDWGVYLYRKLNTLGSEYLGGGTVAAGAAGDFSQTFTLAPPPTIDGHFGYHLQLWKVPNVSADDSMRIYNIVIEWRMP